jgi:hypothetical protein
MDKMPKFGPPKAKGALANPAAPKRVLTAQEAENVLTTPVSEPVEELTTDSEQSEQDIIDEVFGTDPDEIDDVEPDDEPGDEDSEEEIADKPTKPATVAQTAKGKSKGSNLSPEQQKYWDDIGKLGVDQGKGVSSLIFLAEKCVAIGANGVFESSQLKDLYLHFRKNSNSAAGKNAEVGEQDHTVVANTSKLRTFYKVGEKFQMDGWGKMLKVARDIHVSILRSKDERKLLRSKQLVPTYEALVKVASTQMRKEKDAKGIAHDVYPNLLTQDQIREVFVDPNKKETEPSVTDVIKAAAKAIERVQRGKVNPDDGSQTREAFDPPKDDEDDNSVAAALKASLNWVLTAGERYETGFIANREKEIEEAKVLAAERHKKHEERMAKEEAERQARKAKKEADAKAKAAQAALAKEADAA